MYTELDVERIHNEVIELIDNFPTNWLTPTSSTDLTREIHGQDLKQAPSPPTDPFIGICNPDLFKELKKAPSPLSREKHYAELWDKVASLESQYLAFDEFKSFVDRMEKVEAHQKDHDKQCGIAVRLNHSWITWVNEEIEKITGLETAQDAQAYGWEYLSKAMEKVETTLDFKMSVKGHCADHTVNADKIRELQASVDSLVKKIDDHTHRHIYHYDVSGGPCS